MRSGVVHGPPRDREARTMQVSDLFIRRPVFAVVVTVLDPGADTEEILASVRDALRR